MHMLNGIDTILIFRRDPMYSTCELLINPKKIRINIKITYVSNIMYLWMKMVI